jgi:phosphoribosylamine--glycine ligase
MNVLVLGSGGREHALSLAIYKSPSVNKVYVAPGNPGTSKFAQNLSVDPEDSSAVVKICREYQIGLVVVGPENPLALGIADILRANGISVFGPGAEGAKLEASKSYAKAFMERHRIPHPSFWVYDEISQALSHIDTHHGPYVIKADGLALGKGVFITEDVNEAKDTVQKVMEEGSLGEAGKRLVFEEFLVGREMTVMILTDGTDHYVLPFSVDHKKVYEGNEGPMTGGMGAYSPVPWISNEVKSMIIENIVNRTIGGLLEDGIDYRGCLYAGLMITKDGPKILEYNVRFGDPETQCVLPRLRTDFGLLFSSCANRRLGEFLDDPGVTVLDKACTTVAVVSKGYPGSYSKGFPITGIEDAESLPGITVYHAGTSMEENVLRTAGGRVLSITSLGEDLRSAIESSYQGVSKIDFQGISFRKDIGKDALN